MLAISGIKSEIAQQLITTIDDSWIEFYPGVEANNYLFCQGVLYGKNILSHSFHTWTDTFANNFVDVVMNCDEILAKNEKARIVIIGSESGLTGSYDMAYAGSKAALHLYIDTKKIGAEQQLVGIAPHIIGDARMTSRRTDVDYLEGRRLAHPKQRWLTSIEVARLIKFLLYTDQGYITGTVIRMNGGCHV